MKVCFIGIGSIAKRHIRNLHSIFVEKKESVVIDVCRLSGLHELEKEIKSIVGEVYTSLDDLPDDYDVIFITNPTNMHISTLKKVTDKARNFFIEKPITTIFQQKEFDECLSEDYDQNKKYYIACPLRYNRVINYVKERIDFSSINAVRCIASSYLPEWRANTDYTKIYSAHSELGGGVALDLIHEWDYIQYLFGQPKKISCIKDKVSDLKISSEDIACYIAQYDNFVMELHLDYFGRVPIRQMMIFCEDDTIVCDLNNGVIQHLKSGTVVDVKEERDDFQKRELLNFLDLISNKSSCITNDLNESFTTLKLTNGEV